MASNCSKNDPCYLAANFLENDEVNTAKSLELSYSFPNIDEIKTMTVNVPFEDVKRIYNG
jgi:hypothetical protein